MNIDVTGEPILRGLRAHFISTDYGWRSVRVCACCETSEGLFDVAAIKGAKDLSLVTSVCRRCGYGFHSRRPQTQWYRDFYASQWDKAGRVSEPNPKSLLPSSKILDMCESFLGPKGDVLEIGCGFGQSLLSFQRRGYGVYGVEAASHRSRFVRERWGIPCESTCVEDFLGRGADRKFDLVMSHHVLEHLEDPSTYVEALPRLLRPGGYAYLCVPDFWHGQYLPQGFHFIPHVSMFTVPALHNLLMRHGLVPLLTEVTQDIQIVAQWTGGKIDAPATRSLSDPTVETRLTSTMKELLAEGREGTNRLTTCRLLTWRTSSSPFRAYEWDVLSIGAVRQTPARMYMALAADKYGYGGVGALLLSRLLRVKRAWRCLAARFEPGSETISFPLQFRYPSDQAPVWIK